MAESVLRHASPAANLPSQQGSVQGRGGPSSPQQQLPPHFCCLSSVFRLLVSSPLTPGCLFTLRSSSPEQWLCTQQPTPSPGHLSSLSKDRMDGLTVTAYKALHPPGGAQWSRQSPEDSRVPGSGAWECAGLWRGHQSSQGDISGVETLALVLSPHSLRTSHPRELGKTLPLIPGSPAEGTEPEAERS